MLLPVESSRACVVSENAKTKVEQAIQRRQAALPQKRDQLSSLTSQFRQAHEHLQKASSPSQRSQASQQLESIARSRAAAFKEMIQNDPGQALALTISEEARQTLPASVQTHLEQKVAREGTLEVLAGRIRPDSDQAIHHFLVTDFGLRVSLHFKGEPPALLHGAKVRAEGVQLDNSMALDSGSSVLALTSSTSTSILPRTFGAQKTLVIMVNFADNATQPFSLDYVKNVTFTTVSNFDRENSFQQTWLEGDVVGWYTIPLSSTICDYSTLASQARQVAQDAGVDTSVYSRFVYTFPRNTGCTWGGLGTVGGNPSHAWINGVYQLTGVGHEMGHNFGLYHSHAYNCGTQTLGSSCTSIEYGDAQDIMGGGMTNHFNAFAKEQLGWLNYGSQPPILTVSTAGSYTIAPYETQDTGVKALKILKSTDPTTGQKTWYYVEYRQALGFDSNFSTNTDVINGVLVRTGSDSSRNTSNILDMSPTSPTSFRTPALQLGQSFTDPDTGLTLTLSSVSSTGAVVQVALSTPACIPGTPTISLAPSSGTVAAGGTLSYSINVTNHDSSTCNPASLVLSATTPAGWNATLASATLSLAPGASGTTTIQVQSAAGALPGTYSIPVTVTEGSLNASTTASFVIPAQRSLTLSTDQSSYLKGQSVQISGRLLADGVPVSGTTVAFTITKADGKVVTASAVTDTTGLAMTSYLIKKRDPRGTYGVRAQAQDASGASASIGFSVQ
jgi:hypothetical protein